MGIRDGVETGDAADEGRRRAARPYDAAAKQLLARKPLLAYIMKDTLREFAGFDVATIAESFIEDDVRVSSDPVDERRIAAPLVFGRRNEDDLLDDGAVLYDVLFRARRPGRDVGLGLVINVEAQGGRPDYPVTKRAVYYCARLLSSQRGGWPSGGSYERLEKVCSIWLCTDSRSRENGSLAEYSMRERILRGDARRDPLEYDLLSVAVACLPCPGGYNGFMETMATLLSFETSGHDKMRALEAELGRELASGFRGAMVGMSSLGEAAVDYGFAKGIEKGIEQGTRRGEEQATLASIRNLMRSMSWEADRAMEAIGIPEEEHARYFDLLGLPVS